MDEYVHMIYKLTRNFPKEEIYGVTSQLRRAALVENYLTKTDYVEAMRLAEDIGAMLWGIIRKLN